MTRRAHLQACLLFLFASSFLPVRGADWPYYQHDAAHTGASTAIINPLSLTMAWRAPTGYSTPLIVGNTIYATRNQGGINGGGNATLISCFDLATGTIKWTYSGDFVFPTQAAVGGGFVVFHSGGNPGGTHPDGEKLYVLDGQTGVLRYKVPGVPFGLNMMPLLVANPADGTVTAYCAGYTSLCAVRLGATNGSILWNQTTQFGGGSMPTLVGNSIILPGAGRLYAFDRQTGARNEFAMSATSSGASATVTYDAARQLIYIPEGIGGSGLNAYRYTSNAQIDFLWRKTGPGTSSSSVAIGPNGNVYSTDASNLIEVDPDSGATLRTIPGTFVNSLAPAITDGLIWTTSGAQTVAYNLNTLQAAQTLPGGNGSSSFYWSPGAFADGCFALDNGNIVGGPGFDVYAATGVPAAQPLNISTRARIETGQNVMIGGFIISGTEPKHLIIRAIGPSLSQHGIADVIADPAIELRDSNQQLISSNDNWRETQASEIEATTLAPANDLESAMIVTLSPGAYTAIVSGKNGGTGVGLVEVYDLETAAQAKLANISTRGFVGTDNNVMIGGFILGSGDANSRLVIRGLGPGLLLSGVSGVVPDPELQLRDSNGTLVRSNDNWGDTQPDEIIATRLTPRFPPDSAMVVSLAPGAYTAILRGKNGSTGVGLVEVYQLQ